MTEIEIRSVSWMSCPLERQNSLKPDMEEVITSRAS